MYTQEGETEEMWDRERAQLSLDRPDPRRNPCPSDATDHRGRQKNSPHRSSHIWCAGFVQIIATHNVSQ